MEKLQFSIDIQAPASKVYNTVIDDRSYREWTSVFNPSSRFEGSWGKGDKILFTGISKEGKREGMVARIEENLPGKQISIRHLGLVNGDEEITAGPAVEAWANAMEEYFFEDKGDTTRFTVLADSNETFKEYFQNTWPKAMEKIKELSEK